MQATESQPFAAECQLPCDLLLIETEIKLSDAAVLCRMAGFSLEWLAEGSGEPGSEVAAETEPDDYALIPGYNVQVSAGNGSAINEEQVTRKIGRASCRETDQRGVGVESV